MNIVEQLPIRIDLAWQAADDFAEQVTLTESDGSPLNLTGATVTCILHMPGTQYRKLLTVTPGAVGVLTVSAPSTTVIPGVYRWSLVINRTGATRTPITGLATVHG
jgi:hypothetical protein